MKTESFSELNSVNNTKKINENEIKLSNKLWLGI